MFCNIPFYRRPSSMPLFYPCKAFYSTSCKCHHCSPHESRIVKEKSRKVLLPLSDYSGCPSEMTAFSPISPLSPMSDEYDMSPITPYNGMKSIRSTGNVYAFTMPGCGPCNNLKATLRKDGISFTDVNATTAKGRAEFEMIIGSPWSHRTYPQLYVNTNAGWYHVGGNSDYQGMRTSLKKCLGNGKPTASCVSRTGARKA